LGYFHYAREGLVMPQFFLNQGITRIAKWGKETGGWLSPTARQQLNVLEERRFEPGVGGGM
jgi:hypothetical protein